MSPPELPKILVGGATLAAGIFTGVAANIAFAEQPAREQLEPEAALQEWRASFVPAGAIQASCALLSTTLAAGAAAAAALKGVRCPVTGATAVALPLTGAVCFGGIVVYTVGAIGAVNHKLRDPKTTAEEAKPLIKKWGARNLVRTAVAGVGFVALVTSLTFMK